MTVNRRCSSRVWPTSSSTSRPAPSARACQGVTARTSPSTTGEKGIRRCAGRPQRDTRSCIAAPTASPAAASCRGSTPDRSAAVGRSPSSAAQAAAMSAASSGEKKVPGMLCTTARRKRPAARCIASRAATDPPPADWPKTVTRCGVAAEGRDVVAHPLQGGDLVEQAAVGRSPLDLREPLDPHAVVERHHDDPALPREPTTVVLGQAGRPDLVAAALDPHHHRQAGVGGRVLATTRSPSASRHPPGRATARPSRSGHPAGAAGRR